MLRTGLLAHVAKAFLLGLLALAATSASAAGPEEFILEPINGTDKFVLSEQRGRFVALHFLLKTECPVCIRTTRDYTVKAAGVAGVAHVFIKPDGAAEIQTWIGKLGPDAPTIYRDPEATLAKEFDIPFGYQFHGETVHFPAAILLNAEGKEVFRYVGKNNGDRLAFDRFVDEVNKARGTAPLAEYNLDKGKPAIQGYDPVAYFQENAARPGKAELASQYLGVTYHFSSEANRAAFNEAPAKFLPTYGGWCATAMAEGDKVGIDPKSFQITDGRLFLFYDGVWGDAKKLWNKDEAKLTLAADSAWNKLAGE